MTPSPAMKSQWAEFVASRPEKVRAVAERFDPWTLYRLKTTGQRVTVYSFSEHDDGRVSMTVEVTGQWNAVLFDTQVFGIDPDDLEECDLPAPDEVLGTVLAPEAVEQNIDALRCLIRPDLWEMGADGKAKRR